MRLFPKHSDRGFVKDHLVRAMTRKGDIRGVACATTRLVSDACERHGTYPTAAVALGRALTGGALMGAFLKGEQRVALKFEGNGPLKKIVVEADGEGAVRGYVAVPEVDPDPKDGKFDVAGALGKAGFLTVTKDLFLKEPYRGIVRLQTSEIAEDLAYYFTESEQTPSAVGLGVFADPTGVTAAGGFLVQALPAPNLKKDAGSDENRDAEIEVIDQLVARIRKLPPVTEFLREGNTPEALLDFIFAAIPYRILEKKELAFRCSCDRRRVERALISLGTEALGAMAAKGAETELSCEFCRKRYRFTPEDLERLRTESANPPSRE
jgi:molecular chaperone Hsp33